jgi:hypothetical protein
VRQGDARLHDLFAATMPDSQDGAVPTSHRAPLLQPTTIFPPLGAKAAERAQPARPTSAELLRADDNSWPTGPAADGRVPVVRRTDDEDVSAWDEPFAWQLDESSSTAGIQVAERETTLTPVSPRMASASPAFTEVVPNLPPRAGGPDYTPEEAAAIRAARRRDRMQKAARPGDVPTAEPGGPELGEAERTAADLLRQDDIAWGRTTWSAGVIE